MKICHITIHYSPAIGGQANYIKELIKITDQVGIESAVIQPMNRINRQEKPNNVKLTPTIPKIPDWAKWFVFNFFLLFKKNYLKQFDLLICHYPFHYRPISWHPKIIVVSHGCLWTEPIRSPFDRYHKKVSQEIKDKNVVLVANDSDFLHKIGYPGPFIPFAKVNSKTWFLPNGFDTNKFTNQQKPREKTILVVRNILPNRGIDLAIRAFAIFQKSHPNYTLEIAGAKPNPKYYQFCQSIINELELKQVNFLGHLDTVDLIEKYNRATLSLVPSIDNEGTSLSALEAMACGTPTISSAIGGLNDLPTIKSDIQPEIMAEQMTVAIKDWETYSQDQATAVNNNYNLTNWGKYWLQIINELNNSL